MRMGPMAVTDGRRRGERREMQRSRDSLDSDSNKVCYIRESLLGVLRAGGNWFAVVVLLLALEKVET